MKLVIDQQYEEVFSSSNLVGAYHLPIVKSNYNDTRTEHLTVFRRATKTLAYNETRREYINLQDKNKIGDAYLEILDSGSGVSASVKEYKMYSRAYEPVTKVCLTAINLGLKQAYRESNPIITNPEYKKIVETFYRESTPQSFIVVKPQLDNSLSGCALVMCIRLEEYGKPFEGSATGNRQPEERVI